ncbi:mechanosensitive ion channel domain-containing protein [Candidatus Enterovibrio altilux]|uniref:Small-conductance mechanosensitive channel n=1 Tax=Candidatus Enterovibrio altilux TaxID=1927128 RepID=A0A291BBM0_9GAMM|nr:mechanosensitive ion channel domain-containing protein [Candidatus Enterovibrio luxaltus]ATF10384.1 Protein involved in stability of MscS mechanosensitive channel [Candidatus Enterovibrio luxaltus]
MENAIQGAVNWYAENQNVLLQYAVNVISAFLIMIIGNWVVKKITNTVARIMYKKQFDKSIVEFLHSFARYFLFVIVIIAALSKLGIQTASMVAIIGAAGLTVGLAIQGSLSNFAAGVLLVVSRPFKSGDYVEVASISGSVKFIQIFSTVLTTPDNKMIIVPNSAVISSPITNYSRYNTRRIDFMIRVSYSADLQKTKAVLASVLAAEPRLLATPKATIGVMELGDFSVNFIVRPWVKTVNYWGVYVDLLQAIKEGLDKDGIEIPFPQMDIHVQKSDV